MNIRIDASAISQLGEAWKLAPEMVIEELTAATYRAEMLLERETKEILRQPDANGHNHVGVGGAGGLLGSIHSEIPSVLSNTVIGMVGSTMNYAESVELGTRPHPVSDQGVAAIDDWVRHKLGIPAEEAQRVAEAVVWKIRMHGTPAVGMFHRGLAYSQAQLGTIFEVAAGRIGQRLAGAA